MVCKIVLLLSFFFHFYSSVDFDFRLSQIEVRFIFGFLIIVSLNSIQS